jgi:hypothetical protein
MDFPPDGLAPPDTDLGLLQRGRGAGWLRAARSPAGADLLLACVARDPRWDRQVEPRGDYYAQLALHLSVPPSALPAVADPDDDWLRREVLQGMAARGSAAAGRLLAGIGGVDDELDEPSRRRDDIAADAPVELLLESAAALTGPHHKEILQRLRTTDDESEIAALRKAALDVDSPGWRLAMQVLGRRDDPTAIPVAAAMLEADQPGGKRAWAFRYVRTLSADHSLPLAREWLALPDGRGDVAACVLSLHAELSDAPAILTSLSTANDYYAICDLVKALGRLPEAGPFELMDRVYVESGYSYARGRAVDSMAATDPAFGAKWATECLWDCEESVRAKGAEFAPLTSDVTARLEELAADVHEYASVREAAHRRLG